MAEKTTIPLPIASFEYDQQNESANRRLIEQALQDINSEIGTLKTMQQSVVSRSLKRHQFLLMGAKSV
jgi:RNA polymerase-interacting CarD/CdnL/TRCF family regulator|tara:strand:- start:392 stop:595 length:204 start_codon:yes stop_codon:yes gene_type:complete